MNEVEAINKLEFLKSNFEDEIYIDENDVEALNLAITMLATKARGVWIDHSKDGEWYGYQCSECGTLFRREMYMKGYPYCPRCSAFMPDYDFKWKDEP